MRRTVLLALCFAVLGTSVSHAGSVSGRFVEPDSRAPLAAVQVVLLRAADTTVVASHLTESDGGFRFEALAVDRYRLRAMRLGHSAFQRDIEIIATAPDVDLGAVTLAVSAIALPEVKVETNRATTILAPDRNVYLTKDLPGATTGTATDLLRTVPELDVDIDGNVSLRGSGSVNVQFNGRTAPLKGTDLTNYLRTMPASRIERVEVVPNPSAKYDPEGTGGILNLVLKDTGGVGWSGSGSASAGPRYNSISSRFAMERGKLKLFGGLSAAYFRWRFDSESERLNLRTSPPSAYRWDNRNRSIGRYFWSDLSADYALMKRLTLYATTNGGGGSSGLRAFSRQRLADSTGAETSVYDRTDDTRTHWRPASITAGLQHVVQSGRNERSIEVLQTANTSGNETRGLRQTFVPSGVPDQTSDRVSPTSYRERSLQADDTHPLGAKGKIELGYRGQERRTTNSTALSFAEAGVPVPSALAGTNDYEHREVFHSGYVTLGSTFGKLSAQAGIRGEVAHSIFDARASVQRYDHEYRSAFPSANLAWDFGGGRTVRAAYSRRIERPQAWYLDPGTLSSDTLSRTVGNPNLGPRYTDSWTIDANWNGSRGALGLSPYLRVTRDNWDAVTSVDPGGIAITTWRNASSVNVAGVTFTASLRQTGKLGGTLSLGLQREHHDASNVTNGSERDVTGASVNANLTYKVTPKLDLQGYLRYAPARATAQGRTGAYTATNLSTRWKFTDKASASVLLLDPFNLSNYRNESGDATYALVTESHNRLRGVSASFQWSWGKAPEQKRRKQSADSGTPDQPGP